MNAAAYFAHGMTQGRAGQWEAAAGSFVASLRADPTQQLALQALLECAAARVRAGATAPAAEPIASALPGMISFVVCSIDPAKLERLRGDLSRRCAGETWELVHIGDARSLCEGYNRGLARTRGELIVFCHDDIGLLRDDFIDRLRRHLARADLVGVAGSTLAAGPGWFWAGPPHTASWVSAPHASGITCGLLGGGGPTVDSAQALDGVFLAGRRAAFEALPFDADTFDGFHGYDVDLSYRAWQSGLRCTIALDLLLWHQSGGNFSASWHRYGERFLAKHPSIRPLPEPVKFRPGALVAPADLVAPMYAWIAHWMTRAAA